VWEGVGESRRKWERVGRNGRDWEKVVSSLRSGNEQKGMEGSKGVERSEGHKYTHEKKTMAFVPPFPLKKQKSYCFD